MANTINIDQLKEQVLQSLNTYAENVTVTMKEEIQKANRNGLRMVKRKSPELTGRYKKGWSSKKMFENSQALRFYIYNKTDWQLTHLLEYGHIKWLWGIDKTPERVEAIPHIRPTREWVQQELPNGVKARLK